MGTRRDALPTNISGTFCSSSANAGVGCEMVKCARSLQPSHVEAGKCASGDMMKGVYCSRSANAGVGCEMVKCARSLRSLMPIGRRNRACNKVSA